MQWLKQGREPSIHFGSRDSALQARPPPVIYGRARAPANRRDGTRLISSEMSVAFTRIEKRDFFRNVNTGTI